MVIQGAAAPVDQVGLTDSGFLSFLIALALLLAAARVLGEVSRRLGQPPVIGELLAGILFGPSVLGAVVPDLTRSLFPSTGPDAALLQLVARLGVVLLLLLSGIETNLEVVRRHVRSAAFVAVGGTLVPFVAGFLLAFALPPELVGAVDQPLLFALFVATAIAMSAIPVIVKILIDLRLLRRDVGQLILAAGMLTDTAGWFILATIAGAVSAGSSTLAMLGVSLIASVALAALVFTVGASALRWLLAWIDHHVPGEGALFSAVVVIGLVGAAATQALRVEAFLGAFLVGAQLSRIPRVRRKARAQLEALTLGVFAPIFFATAGLRVDVRSILAPNLLATAGLVILVACVGKIVGAYLGARAAGLSPWLALALGTGLNARGAIEIVVATIGLQLGILTTASFSTLVLMAVVTSLMTPPLLRWTLARLPPDRQEEERLRWETVQARSFLHGLSRVLVPVWDGRHALQAARVVAATAGPGDVDVVALHVNQGSARQSSDRSNRRGGLLRSVAADPGHLASNGHVRWQERTIAAADAVVPTILAEARRDYDLMVLGTTTSPSDDSLFGEVVDRLVAAAPCPVVVLRLLSAARPGFQPRRIVVPTQGSAEDVVAAEFAVALARGTGARVIALHVVEGNRGDPPLRPSRTIREVPSHLTLGANVTGTATSLGELAGVDVASEVVASERGSVPREVARRVGSAADDLVVVTARRRVVSHTLRCGETAEAILRSVDCAVAVIFTQPAVSLSFE